MRVKTIPNNTPQQFTAAAAPVPLTVGAAVGAAAVRVPPMGAGAAAGGGAAAAAAAATTGAAARLVSGGMGVCVVGEVQRVMD